MPGVSAGIGSGRGVMSSAPGVTVRSVWQSTCREYGELLREDVEAAIASAVELHLDGLAVDRIEGRRVGHTAKKPSRQSGCVSKASLLSSRAVVPCTALKPRPRRANEAHRVQVSSPSLRRSAAAMIASRATTRPGPQPWT